MANDCLTRVAVGAAAGGAIGGAIGSVWGTIDAVRLKTLYIVTQAFFDVCSYLNILLIPGALKIRHIGQTTIGSAALFSVFLAAGSLIHCGKNY